MLPLLATALPPLWRTDAPRPDLSGPVEVVDVDPFRIHFTRTGDDAPATTDADANDLPDLVDTIAAGLLDAEAAYRDEGWRPLIGDGTGGGDDAIDVYVVALDIFGYANAVPGDDGWSCFVRIDAQAQLSGGIARSVVFHELHHCVEFRYTVDVASWVYEAAATYEQYTHVVDPVLDLAVGVLYAARLQAPERKLASTADRDAYASFLWMKFWTEFDGLDPARLPDLWTHLAGARGWQAGFDAAAWDTFGRPLEEMFLSYATWNSFACGNDDGEHYLADPIPCITTASAPLADLSVDSVLTVQHEAAPFTAHYAEVAIPTAGAWTLTCDGADGLRTAWLRTEDGVARGSRSSFTEAGAPPASDDLTLAFSAGDAGRIVLAGTDAPLDATCTVAAAPTPRGCAHGSAPGLPWWGLWGSWGLWGLWAWPRRRAALPCRGAGRTEGSPRGGPP